MAHLLLITAASLLLIVLAGTLIARGGGAELPKRDRSVCPLATASDPRTSTLRRGCRVISAGRPTAAEDSLAARASELQGDWVHIHEGYRNSTPTCATPAGCEMKRKTMFLATEVGVPDHAYEDLVRFSILPICRLTLRPIFSEPPCCRGGPAGGRPSGEIIPDIPAILACLGPARSTSIPTVSS